MANALLGENADVTVASTSVQLALFLDQTPEPPPCCVAVAVRSAFQRLSVKFLALIRLICPLYTCTVCPTARPVKPPLPVVSEPV